MQIKNIQQFRTDWRNQEGYNMNDWDENFIGSSHDGKLFGFYRMVNGIVDNIKADLTPKLQNAQDEQAIYEFLQNAADSQSTECAVIYDSNYFMVLNNGKPFSDKDLKALLNSFQGTKSDKTKPENCGKIGRYGIGFKLAYRLMGKSDGATELLDNLAGPLLYSWHNSTQFKDLLDYSGNDLKSVDEELAPWLLKIILACFPTGLNEEVKDLDYEQKVLFHEEELKELVAFLNKHRDKIEQLSLEQGSLFFLKFGPKKHEKLKESLLNIQSGIGYSMNTLKTLEKVVLQDVVVEKYDAAFERYSILPGTEDFMRIDPEFPYCPVEIALGFPSDIEQMKSLKRSPSIYQFFPMRNERHNMAYFIHGTSFAKITDRTRLDDQGEANIETFKYIAKTLKRNLTKYKQDNFEQYVTVYKALLMTDKSEEYDADLVNNNLYLPMLDLIRSGIPTHKQNFYLKDLVVVKNTAMNIDPMSLGIGKEWFFWKDVDNEAAIMSEAANNAKLGLRRWGLQELILEGSPQLVDNWIENLSSHEYDIFVKELKDVDFDEAFLERFQYIKCFRFSDNKGTTNFFSIKDLKEQENVFLMSERTMSIREEIKSLGFAVLEFNILDYAVILRQLEGQLDYLSSDLALYAKIADRTHNAHLDGDQKLALFSFLKGLEGIRQEELRRLSLFSNSYGAAVPLQGLLPPEAEVSPWLEGFRIKEGEYAEFLDDFLAQEKSWEVYEYIIQPYWNDLIKHSSLQDEQNIVLMHQEVIQLYKTKTGMPKLLDRKAVYVGAEEGFVNSEEVFFYKAIAEITDYSSLKSAVKKLMNKELPDASVLEYCTEDPFKLFPTPSTREWRTLSADLKEMAKEVPISAKEKLAIFSLLKTFMKGSDLQRLELFENRQGERMKLGGLIRPTEDLEAWLKPFQITSEEDAEVLDGYLCADQEVYPNILVPNWESLVKNAQIFDQIEGFYQAVRKYAELAKNVKPLVANSYVFVNKEVGFITSTKLFYHSAMAEVTDYPALRKAIHQLTGYHTPHPEVLPFMEGRPFKTRSSNLNQIIKPEAVVMSRDEAEALIKFMGKTREDCFKLITIEEGDNSRECLVARRSKNTPYYLDKSQASLSDKIRDVFGEGFKQLPYKLYFEELENNGLLMGKELFNKLSKAKDVSPELLSAMIVESGNADVQEMVFGKISKIVLKQGKIYDKDSFEHQALQIFRNKDADHAKVREKIYIEDDHGEIHKLTDIAFSPQISFKIEGDGTYTLELSEILPRFKVIQELTDDILEKMVDYEAPTSLKRRCFESEEKPLRKVFSELRKEHTTLQNANQLAFVMLMAKQEDNNKLLRDFSILHAEGEEVELLSFEAYHLHTNDFIAQPAILDTNRYEGIEELLRMEKGSRRAIFEFGNQKVLFEPEFDRDVFYCVPLKEVEEEAYAGLQLSVLDFIYAKWKNEEAPSTTIELYSDDHPAFEELNLTNRVFPDQYALLREQLPAWLKDWIGDDINAIDFDDREFVEEGEEPESGDDKMQFITALGVQTHQSNLVKLRRYYADKLGPVASQKQLNDIYKTTSQQLINTVLWLQSEGTQFSSEDDRIHWLRKLYNTLDAIPASIPVPHITEVKAKEDAEDVWDEEFVYQVDNMTDYSLYYFDRKQEEQLKDQYEVTISHLRLVMEQAESRITNINLKKLQLPSSSIDEELDVEHLEAESKEWAADHYLKWREEVPYKVNIYDGKIPYLIKFLGQVVKVSRKGNAVVNEKLAFVNSRSGNIEEALFEVSSRNSLSELMLLQLLRYKNESETTTEKPPVVEKVVERVVVPELIDENEEIIEDPQVDKIKELQSKSAKGKLKMSFDLNELPPEMIEQLLQLSKNTRMIVEKDEAKEESED